MITKAIIFEIHRLNNAKYSTRSIANKLSINRETVIKYLKQPQQYTIKRERISKLAPHYDLINELLDDASNVSAPVILQRIKAVGFDGGITIVKDYLQANRGRSHHRQAFIRFESKPGRQMQIDWGHFNSLNYGETKRKLYALAVIESHSRMLYVEFTHSQKQEVLHQCLVNAFVFFGGAPKEIVVDNMVTAVTERQGSLIRFNDAFLDFLRNFKITPRACNPRAPYEKGKIERSIQYLKQNFWPLRSFTSLKDVNSQVLKWINEVANVRIHQTTGKQPIKCFNRDSLTPLPDFIPDCRETTEVLVYKDFSVKFDANFYTTPPWVIGKRLTLKADNTKVIIFYKQKVIATHARCWERKRRIEHEQHKELVKKIQKKVWQDREVSLFASLGETARDYLNGLAKANQPIKKNVEKLLSLKDQYGTTSLLTVIKKALKYKAYGADYVENILYQEMTPNLHHQPVKLKKENLNNIRLSEPNLAEYDSFVLKEKKEGF